MQPGPRLRVSKALGWAALLGGATVASGWLMVTTALGAPLMPIGLLWGALLTGATWQVRQRRNLRRCCASLTALALAWALAEMALVTAGRAIPHYEHDHGPLLVPDPVLGWSLAKALAEQVPRLVLSRSAAP